MQQVLNRIAYYGFWALVVYMPFHIFLSQSLSLVTGGLEAWKIAKDVILALLTVFTICLIWRQGKATKQFWWVAAAAAGYMAVHIIVWALNADIDSRSAILGMVYNGRLPAFLLLGYGVALLQPSKFVFSSLFKIITGVSTVVALLGIVQYFLPGDILTHLGYGLERGVRSAFFIDDHPDLPRIMSTLREPNALGAYLVLPAAALAATLFRAATGRRILIASAFVIHLIALFLTQSRSAWLAMIVAFAIILVCCYGTVMQRIVRRLWPVLIGVMLLLGAAAWSQRNAPFFQEYIVHSNPEETVDDLDSNDLHWLLVKEGWQGAVAEPLGHGPGTAGLVSIQNPQETKLTENYYVQLAYEIGIAGMLLFIAANIWLCLRLLRRGDTMGWVLCAGFGAYIVTNMLLHSWSNEAVAAQWWLLAGAALVLHNRHREPQQS